MDFPFDWSAHRRFYRTLAELHGPRVYREAAVRGALALASGAAWRRDRDAELPDDTIVIVGHQRSGTTWLHRMLAAHPDASSMPLHTLLLPADGWQRRFDRPRPAWLDDLQDRWLGGMDDIHRLRLHEPEEDEFLLWGLFRSPMCTLDRPWPAHLDPRTLDIDTGDVPLAFYAQAVARSVRRTGRRHVGKNPHFSWRIDALRRALPGVRVVALWRHPERAIPSRLSLIREIWRRRGLARDLQAHHVQRILASSVQEYTGALDGADLDLTYDELCADPLGVVDRIHAAFDQRPLDDDARHSLGPHRRAGRSQHRYALAEFGLTATDLHDALAPVYDRFGFRPGEP